MEECLPSKHNFLSSISRTAKKQKKKKEREKERKRNKSTNKTDKPLDGLLEKNQKIEITSNRSGRER
jgi:hypothetical protein